MIRLMTKADRAFCASSWLRSYGATGLQSMSREAYWRSYAGVVDGYLDQHPTSVLVNPEDDTQILGFANYGPNSLNYLYIKAGFRDARGHDLGLGLKLLTQLGFVSKEKAPIFAYTFSTPAWAKFHVKHNLGGMYVPHSVPRHVGQERTE